MEDSISVRIPKQELKNIENISKESNITKAVIPREVLKIGIKTKMIDIAVDKFQKNEATLSKASELSQIPITQFLDILKNRNINLHYDIENFREDFKDLLI